MGGGEVMLVVTMICDKGHHLSCSMNGEDIAQLQETIIYCRIKISILSIVLVT